MKTPSLNKVQVCNHLQSFAKIDIGVESNDGCISRINSSISGSNLVLGKIDANSEAQPLKVLVARDLSF